MANPPQGAQQTGRSDELWAFITLAVFLVPVLSVVIVGGIGFVVWMQQILFGPTAG